MSLQTKYILDAKTGLFFEPETGRIKSADDFNRSFAPLMGKVRPDTAFQRSRASAIVAEHDYLPGEPKLIIRDGEHKILNVWVDGGVQAAAGDASLWLEGHLPYLLPEEHERAWVLQYLAHLLQRPATKIKSAILVQSAQGVGKNLLSQAISRMMHERDCRQLYGEVLGSRWQADMGNTRLLVLDEVHIEDARDAYNRFKSWVTDERREVERKGVDSYPVRTPRGLLVFTNRDKPLAIEREDRRLFVAKVEEPKRPQEYYTRLASEGLSDPVIAAFKHALPNINISDFDPNAEPPMSGAKAELISLGRPQLELEIEQMRDVGEWPFNQARLRHRYTSPQVTAVLKRLGDRNTNRKVRFGSGEFQKSSSRGTAWAWQDVDFWTSEATQEQMKAALAAVPWDAAGSHLQMIQMVQRSDGPLH